MIRPERYPHVPGRNPALPLRRVAARFAVVLCGLLAIPPAWAEDPHLLYETRCAGCHEAHAREFVFNKLDSAGDELIGVSSGRPVRAFLEAGHGRLSGPEIDLMMEHFEAINRAGGLFWTKCAICHVRAVDLVRDRLTLRDGEPVGRYSGVETSSYLEGHGRLTAEELPVMIETLKRHLQQAGRGNSTSAGD